MTQASEDIKVLVLDDYEGFATSVPAYEKVKARAQVVILRTKLKNDTELANALRDVQILLPVRERTKLGDKELALAPAPQIHFSNRRRHRPPRPRCRDPLKNRCLLDWSGNPGFHHRADHRPD